MTLYNVCTIPDGYRVAKFSSDLDVEGSYIVTADAPHICNCPSRKQPCKHIQLLEWALFSDRVNSNDFYDFKTARWQTIQQVDQLPDGVCLVNMGDTEALHNIIADALGEPKLRRRI